MKNIFLMLIFWWTYIATYTIAANLYNIQDTDISTQLKNINATYQLNTDVVLLDRGDTCADRQDFSDCIRDELDDGTDLVFVINNQLRTMETSVRDALWEAIPKADTLAREQAVAPYLQAWNERDGISAYLDALTTYMDTRCQTYAASTCTIRGLNNAISIYTQQQEENDARQTLIYTRRALGLLILWLAIGRWAYRRNIRQRDQKNLELVTQLADHSTFLRMSVTQDTSLFEEDRTTLLKKIKNFDTSIESLLTAQPEYIHVKLAEEDYNAKLTNITESYQHMLTLLWQAPHIAKQMEEVKKVNL